ncbi:hypothetical protein GT755_21020 [Herbidospora sp. NEAU-GS84]|uniref:Uncharacterized protein n=1 Tax=Herbidospora solisilvae TaxID=2696284 RepID=A0A7C9JGE1_9ACTN|nr:hypothetical protein [Herbidospora solisilvae]NAS24163.1 hypothetical protein [Herbidospora solisilvae]
MLPRNRIGNLLATGIASGAAAWGAVGAWTALTVGNYPWNQWIPFANGVSKGVVLGLLAGGAAAVAAATGARTWIVFLTAFAGGVWHGTYNDVQGSPAPIIYYVPAMPADEWFGTTMLVHWATKEVPPAVVCAAAITLLAARGHRRAQSIGAGSALVLTAIALFLIPVIAADLAPTVQGNGQHVNQGAYAHLRCWFIALPVLVAGARRLAVAFATWNLDGVEVGARRG